MDITGVQIYESDTGEVLGLKPGSTLDEVADRIARRYISEVQSPLPLYSCFDDYLDGLHILLPMTQVYYIMSVLSNKYGLETDIERWSRYSGATI